MEEKYNKRWYRRKCFRCESVIIPVNHGVVNEIHGYKLNCPSCGTFLGWGGKNKNHKAKNAGKKNE